MAEETIRVLIVDDSSMMRNSISSLVAEAGYEVVATAENGKDALAKALASKPQMALLDVNMPIADGVYALEKLVAIMPDIVAVMMTSDSDPEMVDKCMDLGAAGYILKEDSKEEIINTINDCWASNAPE